ncbi:MAG: sigma-54-dependent Fis family transcriptional regulator [Planctomycetes bacterium]|nr:sigma-54-dependent Fis family transcriptional regulator [Planctomycetota bacterium]
MSFISNSDRPFLEALSGLAYCNPFLPERIAWERLALGDQFEAAPDVWSLRSDLPAEGVNVERLAERAIELAERLRKKLAARKKPAASQSDLVLYEDVALYALYECFRQPLNRLLDAGAKKSRSVRFEAWEEFSKQFASYLNISGVTFPSRHAPAHMLACLFQLRRAFEETYSHIVGGSMPAARLRASVWQSIFTRDMRRYRRSLYEAMGDVTTLVIGPSGTGKELVARSIGLARFIPFDAASGCFAENYAESFHAVNLSALSPTLIESELFGHRKGSFTGAIDDRQGWLDVCPPLGTVFLDEIGELDPTIQVKLLRVLQSRRFQRLGETADRVFHGKIIAATNRDLAVAMRGGDFREDFYYRLCADVIHTPSLHEQLVDAPDDLGNLVLFIARRIHRDEAEALAGEAEQWIEQNLGREYPWPGNIRELEQCVRNVMIRGEYRPAAIDTRASDDPHDQIAAEMRGGTLTADELLRYYCTHLYAQTGSYEKAARRLKLDRRTVKSKIDEKLLSRLKGTER